LQKEGYYKKAYSVADEIEKDLEKLNGESEWYEMYSEGVMFLKGLCLGRQRKYRESNKYFKQLVDKKPTNDNFVDWYKSNKENQIGEFFNVTVIVLVSIYLLSVVLSFTNLTFTILENVGVWALPIAFVAWIVSYIWQKIIQKQRLKLDVNQNKK